LGIKAVSENLFQGGGVLVDQNAATPLPSACIASPNSMTMHPSISIPTNALNAAQSPIIDFHLGQIPF
jgi:hypothetical protein